MAKILYFASVREKAGIDFEEISLPGNVAKMSDLIEHLKARGGNWTDIFSHSFRVAVNQEMANLESPIDDCDEIAIFSPVTGG